MPTDDAVTGLDTWVSIKKPTTCSVAPIAWELAAFRRTPRKQS